MKRWTIVMALALAIGLISAPVGVYADSHEAGETSSDSGGDGGGDGGGDEKKDDGNGGDGGGDACGGGEAEHEGSH